MLSLYCKTKTNIIMVQINNMSPRAKNYKYIIYRIVDGVNWYYGAYDDVLLCSEVCHTIGHNSRIVESNNVI